MLFRLPPRRITLSTIHLSILPPALLSFALLSLIFALPQRAAMGEDGSEGPAQATVDYVRDVKPLLRERCSSCHGGLNQESELRVDTTASLLDGGYSGPAIVPGDPESSLLVQRVTAEDEGERMPPEGRALFEEEIALLRAWIEQGAPAPEDEQPEGDSHSHWAFQPPRRPALPLVLARPAAGGTDEGTTASSSAQAPDRDGQTVSPPHPVDAFIEAEIHRRGLAAHPPADKPQLLRRVYLDLIGIPPTVEQLREFLADDSADAYDRVVERLLESPQHGERWGRHWMDVWRYSDWYGRRMVPDVWNSAPQIWRWRDWIVQSLNEDKGYDRMIQEMLAADEMYPEDDEAAVATGYLIRNWYALNPNDWMRSNVEHTAKAFLGLTFNCAHCHDHKYDPIRQDDYFHLRAFFEPIGIRQDRVAGEADPGPFQEYEYGVLRKIVRLGSVSVFDQKPEAPTWFYHAGDERNRVSDRGSIAPQFPEFFGDLSITVEPVELPPTSWYPGLRPAIRDTILAEQQEAEARSQTELETIRHRVDETLPELQEALADAQTRFDQYIELAAEEGRHGALAGRQSLLLDASDGRGIVQRGLEELKTLESGTLLSFQLQILHDAHVNFQLAKDVDKGLTAGFVAFQQGRLLSYQPGTFAEFEVGGYDLASGQDRFEVSLVLLPDEDQCLLTIRSLVDHQDLVRDVPVALNGWNPVGDPTKAISFDVRPGAVVLVDEVRLLVPAAAESGTRSAIEPLLHFDFETPQYEADDDVAGQDGWVRSPFSEPAAMAHVTATAGLPEVRELATQVAVARQAVRLEEQKLEVAEAKWHAAQVQTRSVIARLAADARRYLPHSGIHVQASAEAKAVSQVKVDAASQVAAQVELDADVNSTRARSADSHAEAAELIRRAGQLERDAVVAAARAEVLQQELRLLTAQAKPEEADNRQAEIDAATKQLAAARQHAEQAQAEREDASRDGDYSPFSPMYPKSGTGRRRALAQWITHPENPLTARVAVNHIWLRHFHAPLVADVANFGRSGEPPTHPELLDWLAVELMESGWSMKRIHQLIVTSQAYRRSSRVHLEPESLSSFSGVDGVDGKVVTDGEDEWIESPNQSIDPENRYLWRMNTGRMEAEVIRDSLLATADSLDLTMGGQELENSEALTSPRRTLYFSCNPELDGKSQFGALFDAPSPVECYRRTESIIPQQALALTNSELIHRLSHRVAEEISKELEPAQQTQPQAFISAAYERILTRAPTAEELEICTAFLGSKSQSNSTESPDGEVAEVAEEVEVAEVVEVAGSEPEPARDAASNPSVDPGVGRRASLVRALLNHNDFVTIR